MKSEWDSSLEVMSTETNQHKSQFDTDVSDLSENILNQGTSVTDWSREVKRDLETCSDSLFKFVSEEIKKDIPTGELYFYCKRSVQNLPVIIVSP